MVIVVVAMDGYGKLSLLAFVACVLMLNVGMRWCAWITW